MVHEKKIWKAHMEPKCRLFSCPVFHRHILTSDVLVVNEWPHNQFGFIIKPMRWPSTSVFNALYHSSWQFDKQWLAIGSIVNMQSFKSVDDLRQGATLLHQKTVGMSSQILYILWKAWKECNKIIFNATRIISSIF